MTVVKVWNPTEESVSTRMHGSWFSFAPNQMKIMDEKKGAFIQSDRAETGLVVLPPEFCEGRDEHIPGFEKTPEGLAILAERRDTAIRALVAFHMRIVRNNQFSLRKDLSHQYPSGDFERLAKLDASKGELESMRLVAKYRGKASDDPGKKIEEIDKLMQKIGPVLS